MEWRWEQPILKIKDKPAQLWLCKLKPPAGRSILKVRLSTFLFVFCFGSSIFVSSSLFFRSSSSLGCLCFWGRLHFWGHPYFWGCLNFCGDLYFWGRICFEVILVFQVVLNFEFLLDLEVLFTKKWGRFSPEFYWCGQIQSSDIIQSQRTKNRNAQTNKVTHTLGAINILPSSAKLQLQLCWLAELALLCH